MEALVLSVLPHGEHGAVVRFLGFEEGLIAAFVHGARSRRRRADLAIGTRVALALRPRGEGQLPTATLEAVSSRGLLAFDPDTAAALSYLAQLVSDLLAEGDSHPRLAHALDALLTRMAHPGWLADFARFELLLLAETGFGLDLAACALGGARGDLAFVSPRTGRAVSRAMAQGQPWASRLLPLPP
ncbi:MAG: DNA repair protein RecO, partial [Sphingomonadaceae bacterium]